MVSQLRFLTTQRRSSWRNIAITLIDPLSRGKTRTWGFECNRLITTVIAISALAEKQRCRQKKKARPQSARHCQMYLELLRPLSSPEPSPIVPFVRLRFSCALRLTLFVSCVLVWLRSTFQQKRLELRSILTTASLLCPVPSSSASQS
jgi:hypothetical protein